MLTVKLDDERFSDDGLRLLAEMWGSCTYGSKVVGEVGESNIDVGWRNWGRMNFLIRLEYSRPYIVQ